MAESANYSNNSQTLAMGRTKTPLSKLDEAGDRTDGIEMIYFFCFLKIRFILSPAMAR